MKTLSSILVALLALNFAECDGVGSAWCDYPNKYLSSYSAGTHFYTTLGAAQAECVKRADCGGITKEPKRFSLRKSTDLKASPTGETSWKRCSMGKLDKLGCWKDAASRAIPSLEGKDALLAGSYRTRDDAINKCKMAASARGFTVFAVQHSGQCFSASNAEATYKKYGKSTACQGDGEGGPWANEVYKISGVGLYGNCKKAALLFGPRKLIDGLVSAVKCVELCMEKAPCKAAMLKDINPVNGLGRCYHYPKVVSQRSNSKAASYFKSCLA